jgi:hypothetical protein
MMEIDEGNISTLVIAAANELCELAAGVSFLLLLETPAWPWELVWPDGRTGLCPEGGPETA